MRLNTDVPRFFRKPLGEVSGRDLIGGLMQMYASIDAWGKTAVEVGSAAGESAEIALHFVGHLTCVDPWELAIREEQFDARIGNCVRLTKIKAWSHDAAKDFEDQSIDIVYIDGEHNYENVSRDICAWFPKVRDYGWITGHDYDNLPEHVGVVQAVDKLLGKPGRVFTDSSWAIRKGQTEIL